MKIGIDARWIIEQPSGIGQYTLNLIRALINLDTEGEYFLFFSKKTIYESLEKELHISKSKNFKIVLFPYSVFSIRGQILLPLEIRRLKLDLFHSTNFMIPLFARKTKIVATIHDLIPFLFPEYAPRSKKSRFYWLYKLLMQWIVRKADHLLVDSIHSYQDLIGNFDSAKGKTSIVTCGVDPSFKSLKENEKVFFLKNRWKIKGHILLYVGRQDPYKNLLGLVKIFDQLSKKRKDVVLVIAGPLDLRYPQPMEEIRMRKIQDKVVITGFLSQAELVELYNEASLFVLPSRYEGFGLPVLEAFCCGVPVIASNAASLPDLIGDAGIMLDPDQEDEWVKTLDRTLNDIELQNDLKLKGLKRLKNFTWNDSAKKLLAIYQEMAG